MRALFASIFIDREKLQIEDIYYPIKIEYYKTIAREENVKAKYGIEIVKTEYIDGNAKVETSKCDHITSSVNEADKILTVLRNNEVTPIGMQDILDDMFADI